MFLKQSMSSRRARWHFPAPETPRVIHLPRRIRRRQAPARQRLGALFDRERVFARDGESEVVLLGYEDVVGAEEWRFQAEMLRAECKFLRAEREVAVKKMERTRTQMQRTLRSTVNTLISGRNKISDGETLGLVLEQEIQELAEKLEKLQRRSRRGSKDFGGQSCSNFDKQACFLQRKLEKIGGSMSMDSSSEIREININPRFRIDESLFSVRKCNDVQLEVLKRKMEGMAKGTILEKMEEEYGSMLSTTNNSASTSKRMEVPEPRRDTMCSGRCRAVVRRIVEQVRAETEQWAQMQEMLGQVREEMEELQASRDFWENRARESESQSQTLNSNVQEFKQKALTYEEKAKELEAKVSQLQKELESLKREEITNTTVSKSTLPPNSREAPKETEKRVLICRLKEKRRSNDESSKKNDVSGDGRKKSSGLEGTCPKRSPFRDIGNFSDSLGRQKSSKSVFPLH